jgi:hypothetical protein
MQRFFTETLTYLRTQKQCVSESGCCLYEDGAGNNCAIGYWIPAGHKALTIGAGVGYLSDKYPDLAGVAWPDTERGLELAKSLQPLHDNEVNRGPGGFGLSKQGERQAAAIARVFGLETTWSA